MTEDDRLKKNVAEVKEQVALLNQFNQEVVKPALAKMAESLEHLDVVTTTQFSEYKEEVDREYVKKVDFVALKTNFKSLIAIVSVLGVAVLGEAVNLIFTIFVGK